MANAPINLSIDIDQGELKKWEQAAKGVIEPAKFNKALANAINEALDAAFTRAKREVADRFTIKQKNVGEHMKKIKASPRRLGAELQVVGPGIPAIQFKVKPSTPQPAKRPVISIQYKKDGGGKVPGKFVAMMQSSHVGVFERVEGQFMKKKPNRQAIAELMGPSAAGMLAGEEAREAIQNRANEVFNNRLDYHMRRLFK